jgi:hypothetical protein
VAVYRAPIAELFAAANHPPDKLSQLDCGVFPEKRPLALPNPPASR